jgi:hypothetical protein
VRRLDESHPVAELGFKLRVGRQKNFLTAQHINCQLTIEIEELNKNVLQTLVEKDIRIYFLFLSGLRRLIAIKEFIISSSFTIKKTSRSMKMTKQSSKRSSFIQFLNLFLTKFIVEKSLSTLVVANGRINIKLRSKYTKS